MTMTTQNVPVTRATTDAGMKKKGGHSASGRVGLLCSSIASVITHNKMLPDKELSELILCLPVRRTCEQCSGAGCDACNFSGELMLSIEEVIEQWMR